MHASAPRHVLVQPDEVTVRIRMNHGGPELIQPYHRDMVARIKHYVEENLHGDLSVEQLASQAGYEKHYFTKLFRMTTNVTPRQYVIQRRIRLACLLLESYDDVPVTTIMRRVGYVKQPGFNRAFRRMVGVTPTQFRERIRQEHARTIALHPGTVDHRGTASSED